VQVELVVGLGQQLEAFAVGLEQAVLDAVVNHLDEMAGAAGADVGVAVLGRQRLEERLDAAEDVALAAHHQAETLLFPPDAATGADVEKVNALLAQDAGAGHGVAGVGVAAVNHDVAGVQVGFQAAQQGAHRAGGGHHQPDDARGLELLQHAAQRGGGAGALAPERPGAVGLQVIHNDAVAGAQQPRHHRAPHTSQADETYLHKVTSVIRDFREARYFPDLESESFKARSSSARRFWRSERLSR
jgi:hypothetical protein